MIRADALIDYIKLKNKDDVKFSNEFMQNLVNFIKTHANSLDKKIDNYNDYLINEIDNDLIKEQLRERLKQYRLKKSKELKIEAYKIFTNQEMDFIVEHLPKTLEELASIKGVGNYKIANYGQDIINIINSL